MNDIIVKTVARILIPFIQLYGIFIMLHGHVSPGGGFAGGAMIGTSFVLYTLVFGIDKSKKKFSERVSEYAESGGILLYIALGLIGIIMAGSFLTNIDAGFPKGTPGSMFSGGMIPLLMIGIGIKVASTFITLFHTLIEEEEA